MKKLARLIVVLAVLGLLFVAYLLFGARLQAAYNRNAAERAREAGDPGRAAELYERVLKQSPRDEALRLLIATLYEESGNLFRAEVVISNGIRNYTPTAALYRRLSALYVAQDKLTDAAELLDGVGNPIIRAELRRPEPPSFSLPSGVYEERIEVTLDAGGAVYVSWAGGAPSVGTDLYTGPVALGPGVTQARAIAVGDDGLVSGWAEREYELVNIVDPVVFADPSIERLIRAALGKPGGGLYTDDLWSVEMLVSDEAAVYNTLSDLAHCRELRMLRLVGSGNPCDISALESLDNLTELSLVSFGVYSVDLEWIGRAVKLERLYLPDNMVASAELLAPLTRLTELDLAMNYLLDISPLGRLTALQALDISQNAVQDLEGLSTLTGLQVLIAAENPVTSLQGVETLKALQNLDISGCTGLESLAEISALPLLERVTADRCRLQMLPDLSGCTSLARLNIAYNALYGLEGLEGLPLKFMSCAGNFISSLEPLSGCVSLQWLDASRNGIDSVEPLRGLSSLETLRVENNALSSLLPLLDCRPALKQVYAHGNALTDTVTAFVGSGIEVFRD